MPSPLTSVTDERAADQAPVDVLPRDAWPRGANGWRPRVSRDADTRAYVVTLRGDPCGYCGAAPPSTLDHIRPWRTTGRHAPVGDNTWRNLGAACMPCNVTKGAAGLLVFLARNVAKDGAR